VVCRCGARRTTFWTPKTRRSGTSRYDSTRSKRMQPSPLTDHSPMPPPPQLQLERIMDAYANMTSTMHAKLRDYGIPLEELGFKLPSKGLPFKSQVGPTRRMEHDVSVKSSLLCRGQCHNRRHIDRWLSREVRHSVCGADNNANRLCERSCEAVSFSDSFNAGAGSGPQFCAHPQHWHPPPHSRYAPPFNTRRTSRMTHTSTRAIQTRDTTRLTRAHACLTGTS
jgi:hypothetical protein